MTAQLAPSAIFRSWDNLGLPLVGGKLNTYVAGTTTPQATYTDSTQGTPNTNPVILNFRGEAFVWLDPTLTYKFVLTDALNNLIWTEDNIPGGFTPSAISASLIPTPTNTLTLGNVTKSWANAYFGPANVPVFDSVSGNIGYYARTAAEIAAGVTPTNFAYQAGDLRRYGAKLDGSTNDTAAVNTACSCNSIVFHPGGACVVTSVTVASNQTIYGIGPASVFFQRSATAQFNSVINITSQSNVVLQNFLINGNGNAQSSGEHNHGIQVHDSTDVLITGVTIHDCNGDQFYIASTTNAILTQRVKISNCTGYNLGRQGICLAELGARAVIIENNDVRVGTYVTSSTSHGNPIHLELDTQPSVYVGDIVINGNRCQDLGISVGGNWNNVAVTGNTVRPTMANGFGAIGFVNTYDVSCTGNTIFGDNVSVIDGIFWQDAGTSGAASVKNLVISGNVIDSVAGHGIDFLGTAPGVPSLGQVVISSNVIQNIGAGGAKNGISISTDFPDMVVTGNIVRTVTNLGIVLVGCPNFVLSNNRVAEYGGTYGLYLDINGANVPGPGIVTGNLVGCAVPAGKVGIFCQNASNATRISVVANDFGNTATPIAFGTGVVKSGSWANVGGNDTPVGSFTLGAAASTSVNNTNVTALCKVILVPTNAAAATLMGSTKALYISARTAGTSFSVSTASGVAAAGTETFDYWISV